MRLRDVARGLPPEVWAAFAPVLPVVVWCGNGRPPVGNERVLHALLYVLVSGIGWDLLPWPAFPSARTVRRRLRACGSSWTCSARRGHGWRSGTRGTGRRELGPGVRRRVA